VATTLPPARKSTRVTEAGAVAEAVAEKFTVEPTPRVWPAVGVTKVMTGAVVTAVTLTADEVVVLPFESVTLTVSAAFAAEVGVQVVEYEVTPTAPGKVATTVLPARNCTCVIVAPPEPGATLAVSVVPSPTVAKAPGSGAVRVAVGRELPAVTATTDEVTDVLAESSATAVSVYAPATAGVHATV